MSLALGVLRWSPSEFWRATPRELVAAFAAIPGGRSLEPAARSDLDRLMAAFPDGRGGTGLSHPTTEHQEPRA